MDGYVGRFYLKIAGISRLSRIKTPMMENEILDRPFDTPAEPDYMELADTGKRFVNYLIDRIASQAAAGTLILGFETMFLGEGNHSSLVDVLEFLMIYLVIFLYYTLMEGGLNGKTLGKILTKTRAVTVDGHPLDWKTAALRSACRLIPFEPVSFLIDKGWHDSLSKTCVINDRPVN